VAVESTFRPPSVLYDGYHQCLAGYEAHDAADFIEVNMETEREFEAGVLFATDLRVNALQVPESYTNPKRHQASQ
jgi:hypothetical protein